MKWTTKPEARSHTYPETGYVEEWTERLAVLKDGRAARVKIQSPEQRESVFGQWHWQPYVGDELVSGGSCNGGEAQAWQLARQALERFEEHARG